MKLDNGFKHTHTDLHTLAIEFRKLKILLDCKN